MEIGNTLRWHRNFSPLARRIAVLFVAGFIAFELGKNEVTPAVLLLIATIAGLTVAVELVPHAPRYVRKPESELDSLRFPENGVRLKMAKQIYSPPSLKQLESRTFPPPVWGSSAEEKSFLALRPFYLAYSKRDFEVTSACLKFDEDRNYRDWQPVATVAPEDSDLLQHREDYQWVLVAYVRPGIRFDAKLMLRESQMGHGVAILPGLVASEDTPFHSVFLKTPSRDKQFAATASD